MTTERQMWIYRSNTSITKARHLVSELRQTNFETNLFLAYVRDAGLTAAEQQARDTA